MPAADRPDRPVHRQRVLDALAFFRSKTLVQLSLLFGWVDRPTLLRLKQLAGLAKCSPTDADEVDRLLDKVFADKPPPKHEVPMSRLNLDRLHQGGAPHSRVKRIHEEPDPWQENGIRYMEDGPDGS